MPIKLIPPRPGKSPNWTIRGTHFGVGINQTSGTPDKKIAAKVAAKIRDDIERGAISSPSAPTFARAALKYIEAGGERRFVMILAEHFGAKPIEHITQSDIDEAAIALYPHASPATRNRQVYSPISAIMKSAGIERELKRPKGARGAVRHFYFSPEQADAIISAGTKHDPEYGIFLTFLLYTGARLSEALAVKVENLRLSEATIFAEHTKNGEPRMVHLPPPLVAAIAGHPRGLERKGKLFRFGKCGRLYTWLEMAAEAAGVAIPDKVAYHAFRHTYGAWMRRYGGLDTTGLVMTGAWKSHDAARRYEHAVTSEEARKADRLPTVESWKIRGIGDK
jgi:integrase